MKAIYKKRLLKLAKHLKRGKLGHKKFDFSYLNADEYGSEMTHNGCGTLGCAIGECPFVFPKHWKFLNGGVVLFGTKKNKLWLGLSQAEKFFGLDEEERWHLFHPISQTPELYGGRNLGYRARPKSVAANIEAFIKRKEKE